jgi:hypothetical protein
MGTGGESFHPNPRIMTNTTATLLDQLGGASRISAMTGAQIVVDKAHALLVFKKQTGGSKFTHLKVQYNEITDTYDVFTSRMSRKTFQFADTGSIIDVNAADLKRTCETLTGMFFSL